jgi:NADH dehydrogenase
MFQPLFYQVACGRIEPSNISFPFRKIFQQSRNTQFRLTEVKEIDAAHNKVITDEAEFTYDKLSLQQGVKPIFWK